MNTELFLMMVNFFACATTASLCIVILITIIHNVSAWLKWALVLIVIGKLLKGLFLFQQDVSLLYLTGTTLLSIGFTVLFLWVIWFHKYKLNRWGNIDAD